MKKFLSLMLVAVMVLSFAACGNNNATVDYKESVKDALVVAEAGSAGEELATSEEFFKDAETFMDVLSPWAYWCIYAACIAVVVCSVLIFSTLKQGQEN